MTSIFQIDSCEFKRIWFFTFSVFDIYFSLLTTLTRGIARGSEANLKTSMQCFDEEKARKFHHAHRVGVGKSITNDRRRGFSFESLSLDCLTLKIGDRKGSRRRFPSRVLVITSNIHNSNQKHTQNKIRNQKNTTNKFFSFLFFLPK